MNVKIIVSAKKIIAGILAHEFMKIVSIADNSVTEWWNYDFYGYCINEKDKY